VVKYHPFTDWKFKGMRFPNLSNSRYTKSKNNPSCWIKEKSGLSDPGGECGRPHQKGQVEDYMSNDMWQDQTMTSVKMIQHFRNLEITILSDMWQPHRSCQVIE
jgi:hypothetical protein